MGVLTEMVDDLRRNRALQEADELSKMTPKQRGRYERIVNGDPITSNPYQTGSVKWGFYRDAWKKADKEMKHYE